MARVHHQKHWASNLHRQEIDPSIDSMKILPLIDIYDSPMTRKKLQKVEAVM